MEKTMSTRRYNIKENEVRVVAKYLRISPQKLNLVAKLIRGLKADAAIAQLTFSQRRIAKDVKKLLMSAIANAEHNHKLDIDKLYVKEAYVGKSIVMKRLMYRWKGTASRMNKPFSNMTIILEEKVLPARNTKKDAKKQEVKETKETEVK